MPKTVIIEALLRGGEKQIKGVDIKTVQIGYPIGMLGFAPPVTNEWNSIALQIKYFRQQCVWKYFPMNIGLFLQPVECG